MCLPVVVATLLGAPTSWPLEAPAESGWTLVLVRLLVSLGLLSVRLTVEKKYST